MGGQEEGGEGDVEGGERDCLAEVEEGLEEGMLEMLSVLAEVMSSPSVLKVLFTTICTTVYLVVLEMLSVLAAVVSLPLGVEGLRTHEPHAVAGGSLEAAYTSSLRPHTLVA